MIEDGVDVDGVIRRAIGGDGGAVGWVVGHAGSSTEPSVIALAALLEWHPRWLARAQAVATTRRDRQVVAIAAAHLAGQHELVDALARDHLVDHPDSFIVAWIASDAALRARGIDPS